MSNRDEKLDSLFVLGKKNKRKKRKKKKKKKKRKRKTTGKENHSASPHKTQNVHT